ncbi:MAG TPA: sulfite exporter TauE/SafE family protein [Salinimicrobium sp.]|nr:sulfite exporter TauE/SafE family protein [Salinimicrobium sp.]
MEILALIFIVFIASSIQSGTGFGFSILATPFFLLLFNFADAIQLNIIISLIISAAMTFKIYKDIDFHILKRLVVGSLIGVIPGLLIFIYTDVRPLKIIISLLILVLTILLIAKIKIKRSNGKDFLTGTFSGLLTTSIGIPGPPILIYFSGVQVDKATLRSTTLAFYILIYSLSLLLQFFLNGISEVVLISTLSAIPFVFFGLIAGQFLFSRLNQERFQKIIYVLLFTTGVYLLFSV